MPSSTFLNLPAEKQEKLLEAATREFTRRPFNEASINQIIKEAGIPRGSFYMYFTDKEDLFRYLLKGYVDQLFMLLEECLLRSRGDLFRALMDLYDYVQEKCREQHMGEIGAMTEIIRCNSGMQKNGLLEMLDSEALFQRLGGAVNPDLLDLRRERDLAQAAERLFTTRYLLGCFEETEYDRIPYETVECREHLELAQRIARESMVLLKNDGILPLQKDRLQTIGVIGPNADSRRALVGNYHGTSSRYITLLEGIQDAVGDQVRVLYSEGCHLYRDRVEGLAWRQDRISEALTVAEHSDVVILCLGLDETLEGEESGGGLLVAANYSEHDPYRYILDTKSEKRLAKLQA